MAGASFLSWLCACINQSMIHGAAETETRSDDTIAACKMMVLRLVLA